MSSNTQREQARARIRKQKMTTNLIWGGIGVAVIAAIGFLSGKVSVPLRENP